MITLVAQQHLTWPDAVTILGVCVVVAVLFWRML